MRELRVIGVTPDSAHIVCVDTESGQKFRLPADDKLRAAARGDLARFGQIEIEMEATMRPRDIQARIRAGASVEQVTQESGMPMSRVERFAYPVLLERARAAELAQKAHPIRPDGPAVEILIDVVTAAFSARGHTLDNAEWDAWKDEKGVWVAQLQWQNGRSEIAAHWRYQPDAHGGTVSPLDDPATDLIDPDFGRALRGLASILPVEAETPPAPEPVVAEPRREPARPAAVDDYYEQRAVAGGSATLPATAPLPPGANRSPALPAGTSPANAPAPAEPYRPPEPEPYRPPAAEAPPAPVETPAPAVARPVPPPAPAVAQQPQAPAPAPEPAAPAAPEPIPATAAPVAVEPTPAPAAQPEPPAVTAVRPEPSVAAAVQPEPAAAPTDRPEPADEATARPETLAVQPEPPVVAAVPPAAATDTGTGAAAESTTPQDSEAPRAATEEPAPTSEVAEQAPGTEPADAPAAKPAAKKAPAKAAKSTARSKRGKAPMPSWEDVLLGVRSSGN
ncbi:septation protein SepH [Nocardia sp. NPDC051750]|uniref:septation protein SepH n=1 Tax=Nocardia sp. NPDC051750 TaxID=3364325 RepID=UPI0037A07087